MAAGRDFLKENPADLDNAFLLNETAARNLNLENAIGQEITWNRDDNPIKGNLVGIVKDFNFQSLHLPVKPLFFKLHEDNFNYVLVKVNTADFKSTVGKIESTWKKFDNRFVFEFFFCPTVWISNTLPKKKWRKYW